MDDLIENKYFWIAVLGLIIIIGYIGQKKGWWKKLGEELSKPPVEGESCIVSSYVIWVGKTPITNFIYGNWHNGRCEL